MNKKNFDSQEIVVLTKNFQLGCATLLGMLSENFGEKLKKSNNFLKNP